MHEPGLTSIGRWKFQFRLRVIASLILAATACGLFGLAVTGCGTYGKMLRHGLSGVDDHAIFESQTIKSGSKPFTYAEAPAGVHVPSRVSFANRHDAVLEDVLTQSNTLAFLVLRDGAILEEQYFNGHTSSSISLAFSMSKSVVALLIGCAIDDGLIGSDHDLVTDYLPELRGRGFDAVTLKHVLQMTTGLDYAESDNPFGQHARLYYCDTCIDDAVKHFRVAEKPGTRFRYKSGDNMLLAAVLRSALQGETLSSYLQRRVWQPLGMENDALWSTDGDVEKSWCCLAATARDFGKLGMLYLQEGLWEGNRIVSADWVKKAASVDESDGASWKYQYQWWHPFRNRSHYMMSGHLGQYVYVNPDTRTVVVRLGRNTGGMNFETWQALLAAISDGVTER